MNLTQTSLSAFLLCALASSYPTATFSVGNCETGCKATAPSGTTDTATSGGATATMSINLDSGDCDVVTVDEIAECTEDQGCTFTATTTYSGAAPSTDILECSFDISDNVPSRTCKEVPLQTGATGSGTVVNVVNEGCSNHSITLYAAVPLPNGGAFSVSKDVKCGTCSFSLAGN